MKVVRDNLWLCVDCTMAAVNGDVSGVEGSCYRPQATREMREAAREERITEIWDGLAGLGVHLSPDFDSETEDGIRDFSGCGCDACGSRLAGTMHRFCVLGEETGS